MKFRLPIATLLTAVALSALAAPDATDLPTLSDQFGNEIGLAEDPGRVRVAIVVSARKLRRIKPWEKAMREEFPDLVVVRVADIPRSSPTTYDTVAKKLRKRLPEDVPVGIDLEGRWAEVLGLDTSVPNVLVFDADGKLTYQQSGMYKKSKYPSLQGALLDASAGSVAAAAPGF
ncbi:MAG: TlpA family protein disulfide reductase [Gammaproteobacteria bacterium]